MESSDKILAFANDFKVVDSFLLWAWGEKEIGYRKCKVFRDVDLE
jgi:hypothetical protein